MSQGFLSLPKLSTRPDLCRSLLTEKAAPVMNIIHSIFSLILKFRAQLITQPWDSQQGEAVHPSFIAMQQSYNTFKYYSHFLFKGEFTMGRQSKSQIDMWVLFLTFFFFLPLQWWPNWWTEATSPIWRIFFSASTSTTTTKTPELVRANEYRPASVVRL